MIKTKNILTLLLSTCLFLTGLLLSSCDDDDDADVNAPLNIKTSGFVIVGITASETALVKYVEELPSATIDLSDGVDFPQFLPNALYDHAMFLKRPGQSATGFSKYVVNENGELVEEGVLPTTSSESFRISVRDAETGVFHDLATPDEIRVFNPTTLEITGSIDMTAGFVPGDINQSYQRFMFRGDDVFSPIRGNGGDVSFTSFIVHQANLSTNTFVGDTQRDGDGQSTILHLYSFGQNVVDESGNLYITDAGTFQGTGIFARINKIPAGSNEIDDSYVFEPVRVLNPSNILLPTFTGLNYIGNNKAVALVNATTPMEVLVYINSRPDPQNLSPEETEEVFRILSEAASAEWCELDLEAITVTPIPNIPALGIFDSGYIFTHDGEVYLPVTNENTNENAYYKYNPASGAAEKAFDVTGATIDGIYNLANNN